MLHGDMMTLSQMLMIVSFGRECHFTTLAKVIWIMNVWFQMHVLNGASFVFDLVHNPTMLQQ